MRRSAAVSALALTAALLAGCSDGAPSPETSEPTESTTSPTNEADQAALDAVEVGGDLGATPELTFELPLELTTIVARLETEGSGAPVTADDLVKVDYAVFSGDDAALVTSTWDLGRPEAIPLGELDTAFGPLVEVLVGAPLGSRVLLGIQGSPATDTAEAVPASVMVIEAEEVVSKRAVGEAVDPVDGLPTVTLAADGAPDIEIPADTADPTELIAQPLIIGDGAEVESEDVLTVQYSGWLLDGTQFDSSWANGRVFQTTIDENASLIAGWKQGLVGQTVGSQVLLVVPAELGYGADGSGETIPGDATLVFVVDILFAS